MVNPDLPVLAEQENILSAIRRYQVVLVLGPTGSGKTTQIPQFLLDGGWARKGRIACTEPRRIAAIAASSRIAAEREGRVGEEVGYRIRFERRMSPETKLVFMTSGVLVRDAIADPLLKRYSVVVVDEAHEREIFTDFLLGFLKRICEQRPDFRLVVMSATLDAPTFQGYFPDAALVEIPLRQHPVEIQYGEQLKEQSWRGGWTASVSRAVRKCHASDEQGDILVFLPGEAEIQRLLTLCGPLGSEGAVLLPLHGGLAPDEQRRVFEPVEGRKIIAATNVAESSLTIEGIRWVIDSGLAKVPGFDHSFGIDTLTLQKVSQSSAIQRAGRAGRTQPGICIRLYSEEDFRRRPTHTDPEILRSDLTGLLLTMKTLGIGKEFPFLTKPAAEQWWHAEHTLRSLGAVDGPGEQTAYGRILSRLSLEPHLGNFVLQAVPFGCVQEAATIAAMLSVGRSFTRTSFEDSGEEPEEQTLESFRDPESDFMSLLNLWDAYERAEFSDTWCYEHRLHPRWLKGAWVIRAQTFHQLKLLQLDRSSTRDRTALGKALVTGFRHHLLRYQSEDTYLWKGGLRIHLASRSSAASFEPHYVVSYQVRRGATVSAYCNQGVQRAWIEECVPDMARRWQAAETTAPAALSVEGTLRIAVGESSRWVHVNTAVLPSHRQELWLVNRRNWEYLERDFPVALLDLAPESRIELQRLKMKTLADLPNSSKGFLQAGANMFTCLEVERELASVGATLDQLPGRYDTNLQKKGVEPPEPPTPDTLLENFTERPIEALQVSGKTSMLLWGIGIRTIGQLITFSEKQLEAELQEHLGQRSEKRTARKRDIGTTDVIHELKDRLAYFDLSLTLDEDRQRGFARDRELLEIPAGTTIDDVQAAEILGDQFPLFKQYREGSPEEKLQARNEIAAKNRFLPLKIAWWYWYNMRQSIRDPMIDIDDLWQEGCIGLLRSIERFDYARGFRFSTYGVSWIKQAITRSIEYRDRLKVPIHVQQKYKRWVHIRRKLKLEIGAAPTQEELARALNTSEETVEKFLSVLHYWKSHLSLDQPVTKGNGEDSKATLGDFEESTARSPLDQLEEEFRSFKVRKILNESLLQSTDRRCLELYFGFNGEREHTLEEIGLQFGLTRERIRQLIERALATLRTAAVWEKVHEDYPFLQKPSANRAAGFDTEVADSSRELAHRRRTKLEIATVMLTNFAEQNDLSLETLTEDDPTSPKNTQLQREAIKLLLAGRFSTGILKQFFDEAVIVNVKEEVERVKEATQCLFAES